MSLHRRVSLLESRFRVKPLPIFTIELWGRNGTLSEDYLSCLGEGIAPSPAFSR